MLFGICATIFVNAHILDVNECTDSGLNNCNVNATCNNTIGSYTCTCNTDFTGNGFNCSGSIFVLAIYNWVVISEFICDVII